MQQKLEVDPAPGLIEQNSYHQMLPTKLYEAHQLTAQGIE